MYVHLSKKISVLLGATLRSLAWSLHQGWIAAGGEKGLLKVLKLDSTGAGVSMNQTLEGHSGRVVLASWNDAHRKLTTADEHGLIIVWMLQSSMWYEEMINNRNKSVVADMQWNCDGQRICIAYADGTIIIGSVDGNRLHGTEIDGEVTHVQWSPDSSVVLLCTAGGDVRIHSKDGSFVSMVPLSPRSSGSAVSDIHWFTQSTNSFNIQTLPGGCSSYGNNNAQSSLGQAQRIPALAIAFGDGNVQLMRNASDDSPLVFSTKMSVHQVRWSSSGCVLAITGKASKDQQTQHFLMLYSLFGKLLRTLRLPGYPESLCWESGDLRLALAIDSFVYFANVKPHYLFAHFASTLVYTFHIAASGGHPGDDRNNSKKFGTNTGGQGIMFWDLHSNNHYVRTIGHVKLLDAAGEFCVLVTWSEKEQKHVLVVCNTMGLSVLEKHLPFPPSHLSMTEDYVIVTSDSAVLVWQHKLQSYTTNQAADSSADAQPERLFHIDDMHLDDSARVQAGMDDKRLTKASNDRIIAINAWNTTLVICRESGALQQYALPPTQVDQTYKLKVLPWRVSLNASCDRLAIISDDYVLSFFSLTDSSEQHLPAARKDVWNICWAKDNSDWIAVMERSKLVIMQGKEAEEPVSGAGYLCSFENMEVTQVALDTIMQDPQYPSKQSISHCETKMVRDIDSLLQTNQLSAAYNEVERKPHPSLWRRVAENALSSLELGIASKAFVHCWDYEGVQFVKRLKVQRDRRLQWAAVLIRRRYFDEAETVYRQMDRSDLAVSMRMRMGDWFKAERLIKNGHGNDRQLEHVRTRIGDYYADRMKWKQAAPFYSHAKNTEKLFKCFEVLEDYKSLEYLIDAVAETSPLLMQLGERFYSFGMSRQAVNAYIKAGAIEEAVNTCVLLQQWDKAVELAETYNYQQIEGLLSKYANELLDQGKEVEAVELYSKANKNLEAAEVLNRMANQMREEGYGPVRLKRLYVLASLQVEIYRNRMVQQEANAVTKAATTKGAAMTTSSSGASGSTKSRAAATLNSLITLEQSTAGSANAQSSWRYAEAHHLWLLAHRHLYSGHFYEAMRAALAVTLYEEIIGTQRVQSLVALAAFYAGFFGRCSKAFTKLENLPNASEEEHERFSKMALSIFTRFPPADIDLGYGVQRKGNTAIAKLPDDPLQAPRQYPGYSMCMASAKLIHANATRDATQCSECRHWTLNEHIDKSQHCALCNANLVQTQDKAAGSSGQQVHQHQKAPPTVSASQNRQSSTSTVALSPWEDHD